jgi:hypothetical protein
MTLQIKPPHQWQQKFDNRAGRHKKQQPRYQESERQGDIRARN